MTSIAETDLSTGRELPLRDAEPRSDAPESRLSRRFNLRAYVAGGATATALIAGAVLVFASLATYVAFNGFPVGGGEGNASQLTVAAPGSTAPESAAAALGRAPSLVAAGAAASSATATAPGARAGSGNGAGGANGGSDQSPANTTNTTTTTTTSPAGSGATTATPTNPVSPSSQPSASSGPVGSAVNEASNSTNLPLDDVAGGPAQQVDDIIGGAPGALGNTQAGEQLGGGVNNVVGGATQGAGDLFGP